WLPQRVTVEPPEVGQAQADFESDRPVYVVAFDGGGRMPFRMTLDADVDGRLGIESGRVDDRGAGGAGGVIAGRPVAAFAADVPLGDGFPVEVVVHGMTAVAEAAGGAGYAVGAPLPVGDVPLRRERCVIVTNFPEVALFPLAAVDEGDLVSGEGHERIGLREVQIG